MNDNSRLLAYVPEVRMMTQKVLPTPVPLKLNEGAPNLPKATYGATS